MTRVSLLRAGYGAIALAFVALGLVVALEVGAALAGAFLLALLGAILFVSSGEDLPRWAGLALVAYFLLSALAFLAATPITVRLDFFDGFLNARPSPVWNAVLEYLLLALPLMLAGTAAAAAWEGDPPPRLLLLGAVAGFVMFALLHMLLTPRGEGIEQAAASAQAQAGLMKVLFGVSAAAAAAGAVWAAGDPAVD